MVFIPALSFAGPTIITSLPYTITASGTYKLQKDLVSVADGILVQHPNVVINLSTFTIRGPGIRGPGAYGVNSASFENVVVKNGGIEGFGVGVNLGSMSSAQNLRVIALDGGIVLGSVNSDQVDSEAFGCTIIGFGNNATAGITTSGPGCIVRENRVYKFLFGMVSVNGHCEFVQNGVADCQFGLSTALAGGDYYQGNVLTNIKNQPFIGPGVAIGTENGGH